MQRYCDWELCTSVAWLKIALPFLSAEHYLSSSNYMDCISSLTGSNGCNLNSLFKGSDLPELFSKLGLGKYTDVFQQQEVSILLQGIFVLIVCFTTVVLFLDQRCVISHEFPVSLAWVLFHHIPFDLYKKLNWYLFLHFK